jgi:hypothetical protein
MVLKIISGFKRKQVTGKQRNDIMRTFVIYSLQKYYSNDLIKEDDMGVG